MAVKKNNRNETADLRAQIEALEKERKHLMAGGPTLQAAGSFAPAGEAKYTFRVVGRGFAEGRKVTLPPAEIAAPDESEAVRIYCLAEQTGGRLTARSSVLEPSSYVFDVECLSPERKQNLRAAYEAAGFEGGQLPAGVR